MAGQSYPLRIIVSADGQGFTVVENGVRRAVTQVEHLGDETERTGQRSTSVLSSMTGQFSALGAVLGGLGLAALASDAMNTYRSFESMNASLKTMTGSAAEADAAFSKIEEFAKTTPYNLEQSVQGFVKLKALGLDPSMEALRSYGNTASAMGKDMMDMVEAVADASTFEFERLKEFGIKSSQEKDKVSFTFQGVTTTVKKNSEEIQKYLLAIGDNQFGTAMADQMNTVNGAVSNAQDTFAKLQRVFIEQTGAADLFKSSLGGISSIMESAIIAVESGSISFETMGLVVTGLALFLSRNMITAGAAFIASQLRVAASTAASTAAFSRQTLAAGSLAVSQIAAGGSVTATSAAFLRQTGAAGAATVAARGLSVVMALLGGPVGLFALAALGVYTYREEIHEAVTHTGNLNKVTRETSEIVKQAEQSAYDYADATLEQRKQIRGATEDKLLLADATLKAAKADVLAAQEKVKAAARMDAIAGDDDPFHTSLSDTRERELASATAVFDEQAKRIDALNDSLSNMTRTHAGLEPVVKQTRTQTEALSAAQSQTDEAVKQLTSSDEKLKSGKAALTEAEKLHNKAVAEAASLTESLRTPQEEYNATIGQAKELLSDKLITDETYNRLLAEQQEKLDKALSPQVKLTEAQEAAKKVSDELAKAKESAILSEEKSVEALEIAQKSIQMTDEQLEALTLSYKDGYTKELANAEAANNAQTKSLQDQRAAYQELSSMTGQLSDLTANLTTLQKGGAEALEASKVVQSAVNELKAKGIDLESDLAKEYINTAKSIADVAKEQEQYSKLLADAKSLYDATRNDAEKYAAEVKDLDKLLAAGVITQDTYNRALEDASESYTDAGKAAADYKKESEALADKIKVLEARLHGGKDAARAAELANKNYNKSQIAGVIAAENHVKATEKQIDALNDLKEAAKKTSESINQSLTDAFLSGDFSSIGSSLVDIFKKDIAEPILNKVMKPLSDAISNSFSGIGNSISNSLGFGNQFGTTGTGGGIMNTLMGGGMSGGLMAGGLGMMAGQMFGQTGIGSGIGAGIGNMLFPGIGGAVGGLLGGLVESLFGGPQEITAQFGSFGSVVQEEQSVANKEDRIFYQTGRSDRTFQRTSALGQIGILSDGSKSLGRDGEDQIPAVHAALDAMEYLGNTIGAMIPDTEAGAAALDQIRDGLNGFESDALNTSQLVKNYASEIYKNSAEGMKAALQGLDGGFNNSTAEEMAKRIEYVGQVSANVIPLVDAMGLKISERWDLALRDTTLLVDEMGGLDPAMQKMQYAIQNLAPVSEQFSMQFNAARDSVADFNESMGLVGAAQITTTEGLWDYIQAQDMSTEAGRVAAAAAFDAAGAMATFAGAISGIKDMFGSTIEQIELDLMTQQEKQLMYMSEAEKLFAELQAETDPGRIAEISEQINAAVNDAWSSMTEEQKEANADYLKNMLEGASAYAEESLKGATSNADLMTDAATSLDATATEMASAATDMSGAASAINSAASAINSAAADMAAAASIPATIDVNINMSGDALASIPAHASGGHYAGGLALVGEQGPELINFSQPGYIHTAAETQKLMDSQNINIPTNVIDARPVFSAQKTTDSNQSNAELIAELKELRKEVNQLRSERSTDARRAESQRSEQSGAMKEGNQQAYSASRQSQRAKRANGRMA